MNRVRTNISWGLSIFLSIGVSDLSAMSFLDRPIFSHIKFSEDIQMNVGGVAYCGFALVQNQEIISGYDGIVPCEMAREVLNAYRYNQYKRVNVKALGQLIEMSSEYFPIVGDDIYSAILNEYAKRGSSARLLDQFEASTQLFYKSLSAGKCPDTSKFSKADSNSLSSALNEALSTPANQKGSLADFMNEMAFWVAKRGVKLSKLENADSFSMRPKCRADFYRMEKADKITQFFVCSAAPFIECE